MAKIKILSKGELVSIRVKIKEDRSNAKRLYNELTAAVHVGAAIDAQINRGNISDDVTYLSDSAEIFYISDDALPLVAVDLTGEGLRMLKRARRKLAAKLGYIVA